MPTVSVRYIVDDVDSAIEFYCQHLGFHDPTLPEAALGDTSTGQS